MTYQGHIRITFSGVLGANSPEPETFSFGLSADAPVDLTQAQNDQVAAAAVTMFSAATTKIASYARLTLVKSAAIGTDGKYINLKPIETVVSAYGGAGTPIMPAQVALAVSLGTATRNVRGRYYLPPVAVILSASTLAMDQATRNAILANQVTFLNAVNQAVGGGVDGGNPVVVASSVGIGVNARVNSVRVGLVLDTMRSRRRNLVEAYAQTAIP